MAKQRGPASRRARASAADRVAARVPPKRSTSTSPVPPEPGVTPAFAAALARYEQGLAALHRQKYAEAAAAFEAVLSQQERELHDRARQYLKVCRRHLDQPIGPQTVTERISAAAVAINGGRYQEAERLLDTALAEAPDHDHAHFMLAVARLGRGASNDALKALARAIALNPENRAIARTDPDLAGLRPLDEFKRLVGASGRREPGRGRS